MRRKWLLTAILLSSPAVAFACLWDRDTPAEEAKGLPEVVAVITGRFPRNPPLYYEMRLGRVARHLQEHPEDLWAYDDAGVACDRLGRGDEAVAWMERKRTRLDALPEPDAERREHEYRYHANLGTFLVHRWIRSGADRTKLKEVEAARDEIAAAIAINPDAHFGREVYQLRFLEWLLAPPSSDSQDLPNFLGLDEAMAVGPIEPAEARKIVRGLSGLIVLGNAWESVDVYHALRIALGHDTDGFPRDELGGRHSLAYLAWLRCRELIERGRVSMLPNSQKGEALLARIRRAGIVGSAGDLLEPEYARLRAEADAWQAARTEFMMNRLLAGQHPDYDPAFWSGYREWPPPSLPSISLSDAAVRRSSRQALWRNLEFGSIIAGVLAVVLSPWWLRALVGRRRKARSMADLR